MRIEPFRMERMQSRFENVVEYNLSESGVHPMTCRELLDGAPADAADLLGLGLGYTQSNGTGELRDRIAALYAGATRDNVLVANGGSEANFATLWSLLEKNDRVAYMLPNYMQTWGLSRAYAGRTDPFRLPDGIAFGILSAATEPSGAAHGPPRNRSPAPQGFLKGVADPRPPPGLQRGSPREPGGPPRIPEA